MSATKAQLVEAANTIVMRDGAGSLTLDAVAREAALSKGGMLYHFPTKHALLRAMVEGWLDDFDAAVEAALLEEPEDGAGGGRWLRAFIRASASYALPPRDSGAPLLAAVAHDHTLLELVREREAIWHGKAAEGMDAARATLLRLAANGLAWAELLGTAPPTGALRDELIALMLELSRPGSR